MTIVGTCSGQQPAYDVVGMNAIPRSTTPSPFVAGRRTQRTMQQARSCDAQYRESLVLENGMTQRFDCIAAAIASGNDEVHEVLARWRGHAFIVKRCPSGFVKLCERSIQTHHQTFHFIASIQGISLDCLESRTKSSGFHRVLTSRIGEKRKHSLDGPGGLTSCHVI